MVYICCLYNLFCLVTLHTKFSVLSLLAIITRWSNRASLTLKTKNSSMMVCSFNTDSLLGNEQRFKFKGKVPFIYLPWSPLSPLRPSRPSLPGTPLCPGSPGMPGCPQTQPLACVCSCATHLAIQRSSSRVRIHLTCNIAIIAHRIKVRQILRSRPRVKPY